MNKNNMKNILRKVAALLILNVGLVILLSPVYESLQLSYIVSMSNNATLRLQSILPFGELSLKVFIAIIIILSGIYLWDWDRKLKITGILACLAGCDFVFTSVRELYFPTFKIWNPNSLSMRYFITAMILYTIGATLLLIQNKRHSSSTVPQ